VNALTPLFEQAIAEVQKKREADATAKEEARRVSAARRPVATGAGSGPIERFNAANRIEDLMLKHGYEAASNGHSWQSPLQQSGSFATRVYHHDDGTEHWVSQSESDAEAGLGRRSASGARFGDAFDLYVFYEHNGDRHAALLAWQAEEAKRQQAQVDESTEGGVGADATAFQRNSVVTAVDWSKHADVRNAAYFADSSAGEIAYIPQQQRWMMWQNSRWVMCLNGEEVERAKEVCKALYAAAGAKLSEDPEKGQKYVRQAAQAHLLPRIKAMLELAKSDPKLVVPASKLDANPRLLGVGNGVVDLRKKMLLPNEPDYFIIRYCYADFDPSAQCPGWLRFLDAVFQGNAATIEAVQLLLGYTLTGYNCEEIMIFCVGFGANGKSIFGNVVSAILGDYSCNAPSQLLAARRTDDHGPRNDMAMLDGARLVTINELPAGMHLDEQVVKQLAGREPISARFLHKEYFTYEPRFTPWVRTNHKPIVKGDDDGIWRRIVILPFRRTFAPHEQDLHLEGKLLKERDGILAWMVEGARRYLREGLELSPVMKREQAQYRKDSDMLGEFLNECTEVAADARVEQKALFLSWQDWCKENGVQPGSKKTFTQRLSEGGFPPKDSNGKRYYQGLRTSGGLFPHSAGSAG
jgi:putative DNA primase/helicase